VQLKRGRHDGVFVLDDAVDPHANAEIVGMPAENNGGVGGGLAPDDSSMRQMTCTPPGVVPS
jgi:hypothetical protein